MLIIFYYKLVFRLTYYKIESIFFFFLLLLFVWIQWNFFLPACCAGWWYLWTFTVYAIRLISSPAVYLCRCTNVKEQPCLLPTTRRCTFSLSLSLSRSFLCLFRLLNENTKNAKWKERKRKNYHLPSFSLTHFPFHLKNCILKFCLCLCTKKSSHLNFLHDKLIIWRKKKKKKWKWKWKAEEMRKEKIIRIKRSRKHKNVQQNNLIFIILFSFLTS